MNFNKLKNPFRKRDDLSSTNDGESFEDESVNSAGAPPHPKNDAVMSSNEGSDLSDLSQVRSRKILGVVVCVAAFGVGAMAFNSMFNEPPTIGKGHKESLVPNSAAEVGNMASNGLPTDYSSISKYNSQKKADQIKNKAQNQATNKNNTIEHDYSELAPKPLPPIQTSSRNANGSNSISSEEAKARAKAEEERKALEKAQQKAYTSSIAFMSKGSNSSSGNSGNSSSVTLKPGSNGGTAFFGNDPAGGSYTLQSGSVIQATLLTGINSDMGNTDIVAQITQNVYDSLDGAHLLIPQGSKLIGKAGSVGGTRVGAVFNRIIFPDGSDIQLPSVGVVDGTGIPGLHDQYNSHDSTFFRGALISGLLGYLADKVDDSGGSTTSSGWGGSTTTYNDNLSEVVDNITDRMIDRFDRQSSRPATVTIRPGSHFSLFINADLNIPEYMGYSVDANDYAVDFSY